MEVKRYMLKAKIPLSCFRSIDGSVPKVSDVVVFDQGFTFSDGKPGCLVYGINEAGEYRYEAEVYESELGHDSHS